MKKITQAISTARGVALLRAIEMTRPEAERVCSDPYARRFVNPLTIWATRLMIASGLSNGIGLEGAMNFAIAREQYIHDLMAREAAAGAAQLVVLGAGFDTRAYRIPELDGGRVFEVDHPSTQAAKREALRGVVEPFPANVTFVAVDFDRDDLGKRLRAAGYDPSLRTLFVWQGVTMYLTQDGIDRTLAFIARHSGPESMVVFDYFFAETLSGGKAAAMRFATWAMGEHLIFGIGEDQIGPFLESRGFSEIRSIGGAELKRLYLVGRNAKRPIVEGAAIASARVPG